MTKETTRAAFEKWFKDNYGFEPRSNDEGVYGTMFADGASKGYQAATDAMQEQVDKLEARRLVDKVAINTYLHTLKIAEKQIAALQAQLKELKNANPR